MRPRHFLGPKGAAKKLLALTLTAALLGITPGPAFYAAAAEVAAPAPAASAAGARARVTFRSNPKAKRVHVERLREAEAVTAAFDPEKLSAAQVSSIGRTLESLITASKLRPSQEPRRPSVPGTKFLDKPQNPVPVTYATSVPGTKFLDKPQNLVPGTEGIQVPVPASIEEEAHHLAARPAILDTLAIRPAVNAVLGSLRPNYGPAGVASRGVVTEAFRPAPGSAVILDKLGQIADLTGSPEAAAEAASLDRLRASLEQYSRPAAPSNGYREGLEYRDAFLSAVGAVLDGLDPKRFGGSTPLTTGSAAAEIRDGALGDIISQLDALDDPRTGLFEQARKQWKLRRQLAGLLASVKELRDKALAAKHRGRETDQFRQNFARLSMVMELAFSLNKLVAAQAAIREMQRLLRERIKDIDRQDGANGRAREDAEANKGKAQQWKDEAEAAAKANRSQAASFRDMRDTAAFASERVASFRSSVAALLASIDDADGNGGPAPAEYRRLLRIMPDVRKKAQTGDPADPDALSVAGVQKDLDTVNDALRKLEEGAGEIQRSPIETAGVLIPAVPGTPAYVGIATVAGAKEYVPRRREHWQKERDGHQTKLANLLKQLDEANPADETDAYGRLRPQSKTRMLKLETAKLQAARSRTQELQARIDNLAVVIEGSIPGARLPRLSGLAPRELATALEVYPAALGGVPSSANAAGLKAKLKCLEIAEQIPPLGRAAIEWVEAEETVKALVKGLHVLRMAKFALESSLAAMDAVLAEDAPDLAYLALPTPNEDDRRALRARKLALVETLRALLHRTRDALSGTIKPYAEEAVALADASPGHAENFATLVEKKLDVYERIQRAADVSYPWAIAAAGAPEGDVGAAQVAITGQADFYRQFLTGWTDAEGKHKGISELKADVEKRRSETFAGRDTLYGRDVAYALPVRIRELTAAKSRHLENIRVKAEEIDRITPQIAALSGEAFELLSPLASDPNRLKDLIMPFGSRLEAVAERAKAAGGKTGTDENGMPVIDDNQRLALLVRDALLRLLPSRMSPDGSSLAENTADWLWADGVATRSAEALRDRVPAAERILGQGETVVEDALRDLDRDRAYVAGGETGDSVLQRKRRMWDAQAAFFTELAAFFEDEAASDEAGKATVDKIVEFYQAKTDIAVNAGALAEADKEGYNTMIQGLEEAFNDLESQRRDVLTWLSQLNPKEESALNRLQQSISAIQDATLKVLEQKVRYDRAAERLGASDRELQETFGTIRERQRVLAQRLQSLPAGVTLDPETFERTRRALAAPGAWLMPGDDETAPSALVVSKADWPLFAQKLVTALQPSIDVPSALAGLEHDPSKLSQLVPGSQAVSFGDDANGFYLVYAGGLSTPGGISSSQSVTLGNVARLFGTNVSVGGYHFASPPSPVSAPFGDQGLSVQFEAIEGKGWVNYLDVTVHRFLQDLPKDKSYAAQKQEMRILVFNDFAAMVMDDRLYIGAAGFADFARQAASEKPYYYGGNVKASLKFSEVVKLNAEQSALFAKDPRTFFETLNLDFTGFDKLPEVPIHAGGEQKEFRRTKIGPTIDLGRMLEHKDAFTMDFWVADTRGTDEYEQVSAGAAVLKGFSFPAFGQQARLDNRVSVDAGAKLTTITDRVTFTLPDTGLTLSAEGKLAGGKGAYYFESGYATGPNSQVRVGYGAPYIGMQNRLSATWDSQFTLGNLFRDATAEARDRAAGGKPLAGFRAALESALNDDQRPQASAELKAVYETDVARRLLQAEAGELAAKIGELRDAGALFKSARVRSRIGFVSGPVSNDPVDRAVGGGFQAGVATDFAMSKTRKALLDKRLAELYLVTVRLRERLVEASREWQEAVLEAVTAEWESWMAGVLIEQAPDPLKKRQAEAAFAAAKARARQAALRYNTLTGRDPAAALPFTGATKKGLSSLMLRIRETLLTPAGLERVLGRLDPAELEIPGSDYNVMDWLPWVDRVNVTVGAQLQDLMASQLIGAGVGLRLPIWNVAGKEDEAYVLETEALLVAVNEAYREARLRAAKEGEAAALWRDKAEQLETAQPRTAELADLALSGYRNGLLPLSKVSAALEDWRAATSGVLDARARAILAEAQRDLHAGTPEARTGPATISRLDSLDGAWKQAVARSGRADELALRAEAAQKLGEASSRISRVSLDVLWGSNLVTSGTAWLPALGVTGLSFLPIPDFDLKPEELAELQRKQASGSKRYYDALKARAEVSAAAALHDASVELWNAKEQAAALKRSGLDSPQAKVTKAELDSRQRAARLRLNHLLGQPLDAPMDAAVDPAEAGRWLAAVIAKSNPTALDGEILKGRVEVARAAEVVVDKGLKPEEIRLEPVSLIMRSVRRLADAIGGDPTAGPQLVAAARIQTLQAEHDLAIWERKQQRIKDSSTGHGPRTTVDVPSSLEALARRLIDLEQADLPSDFDGLPESFPEKAAPVDVFAAGRLYYARTALDGKTINRFFNEGWVELRLRDPRTDTKTLSTLAKLHADKAERLRAAALSAAATRAEAAIAEFEALVRLKRWAGSSGKADLEASLAERASALERALEARLGLPETADLAGLVPGLPEEGKSLEALTRRFLTRMGILERDAIRLLLYDGASTPEAAADRALSQLQADRVLSQMSYKGFTPFAAIGLFRGTEIKAYGLTAPDPQMIQERLVDILGDAWRREMESRRRLAAVTLRLHSLLKAVEDGATLAVRREAVVRAAADRVKAEGGSRESVDVFAASFHDLTATLVALRMDFTALVVDLEALGIRQQGIPLDRHSFTDHGPRATEAPKDVLLDYWTSRFADPKFAEEQAALFETGGADIAARARAMMKHVELYQKALADAATTRGADIDAPQRLKFLTLIDPEGRRLVLRKSLEKLLDAVADANNDKLFDGLVGSVRGALALEQGTAKGELRSYDKVLAGVRGGFRQGRPESPAAKAALDRVEAADQERRSLRRELWSEWLAHKDGAAPFLMRNMMLDRYLQSVEAYDKAVTELALSSPFGGGSTGGGDTLRFIDSLFDLRASLERRRDRLQHGRGLLALGVLAELSEARLTAVMASDPTGEAARLAALEAADFRETRERWTRGAQELQPLYAVVRTEGEARAEAWLSKTEVEALRQAPAGKPRIVTEDGRDWYVGKDGRRAEVWSGVDATRAEHAEAKAAAEANRAERAVGAVLKTAPFAMGAEALDWNEFSRLRAEGRLFYFASKRSAGLRYAIHPWLARSLDPAGVELLAYTGEGKPDRERYPTREAVEASPEAARFKPVRLGARGLEALAAEADVNALRSRRAGWVSLKLSAYAFALDADGALAEVFLTEEEYDKAAGDDKDGKRRLLKSDSLALLLADGGELLGVEARAERGADLKVWLRSPESLKGSPRRLSGRLAGVELDRESRLVRVWESKAELERAAKGWELKDVAGRKRSNGEGTIATFFRVQQFVDPETGLQVYLDREFLLERLAAAESMRSRAVHYAYLPQNWLDLPLEIPRSIAQVPVQLLTGRDPYQHHYLGRVYMYRTEGGATKRYSVPMHILHFIDILDLLPDKVDRWLDPSQFPQVVRIDGPLLPGEQVGKKSPRTGDHDIRFGKGASERAIAHAKEDLEAARAEALLRFKGGTKRTVIELRRGRAGLYEGSAVTADTSPGALLDAGGEAGADGETTRTEAAPGGLELDRVTEHTTSWSGADGEARRAERLRGAEAGVLERLRRVEAEGPALEEALLKREAERLAAERLRNQTRRP